MPVIHHLIADTFGTHIGKYSGRLKITQKGQTLAQAPLLHLESVHVLSRGVSVSSDALESCCERGIPVFFVDRDGAPFASVYAPGLAGTVLTRREQLRAYDDIRGFQLAVAFALGKIQNQSITLRYLARGHKEAPVGESLHLAAGDVLDYRRPLEDMQPDHVEVTHTAIMGIEGNAARVYWSAARQIVPDTYGWIHRTGRGAADPVNSLLNYGYGILYGQVERALVLAGLDPYAGFLHMDRPGKPSLVLDQIEEFRQVAVDRVVFGLVARHFNVDQDERGHMCDETRRTFAKHVLDHLEAKVRYEGARHPLRHVIQSQARRLAAFLRGETDAYLPYKGEA